MITWSNYYPTKTSSIKIEYLDNQENMDFILSEFSRDMYFGDLSMWMYNGGGIQDRPSDIGYALNFIICKSYYEQSDDKRQAIWELFNTDDFESILKNTDYGYLVK